MPAQIEVRSKPLGGGFFALKKHAKCMFLAKNALRNEVTQGQARVANESKRSFDEISDEVDSQKISAPTTKTIQRGIYAESLFNKNEAIANDNIKVVLTDKRENNKVAIPLQV